MAMSYLVCSVIRNFSLLFYKILYVVSSKNIAFTQSATPENELVKQRNFLTRRDPMNEPSVCFIIVFEMPLRSFSQFSSNVKVPSY